MTWIMKARYDIFFYPYSYLLTFLKIILEQNI